jgi:hypothetical protein
VDRKSNSNDGFPFADHVVASVHEVQDVWPHLFHAPPPKVSTAGAAAIAAAAATTTTAAAAAAAAPTR